MIKHISGSKKEGMQLEGVLQLEGNMVYLSV